MDPFAGLRRPNPLLCIVGNPPAPAWPAHLERGVITKALGPVGSACGMPGGRVVWDLPAVTCARCYAIYTSRQPGMRGFIFGRGNPPPVIVSVRRVPLRGDYDARGRYWGAGPPSLYVAETVDGDSIYMRAGSQAEARAAFRATGATFASRRAPNPIEDLPGYPYMKADRSRGSVGVVGNVEYYVDGQGELFRAPLGNVIDVHSGYRIGRWEGPKWQVPQRLKMLGLDPNAKPFLLGGSNPLTSADMRRIIDLSRQARRDAGREFRGGRPLEAAWKFGEAAGVGNVAVQLGLPGLKKGDPSWLDRVGREGSKALDGFAVVQGAEVRVPEWRTRKWREAVREEARRRGNPPTSLRLPPQRVRGTITIEEARQRRVPGIEEAISRFRKFHGCDPSGNVTVYDDGRKDAVAGFLIGRSPEVTYDDVPSGSNKGGNPWVHKTSKRTPTYLVHVPLAEQTLLIGGMRVQDWLREKGERKEH